MLQSCTITANYGRTHAGQKATRRECVYTGKSKCRNTSPLELVVPDDKDYYCTRHFPKGLLGKDPDRLRCIAIKRKTGELCTKQEYKALCPDQDRRTFLCESHRNRCRGRIFRVRHGQIRTSHPYKLDRIREKPSDNLEVLIRTGRKDEIQKVRRLVFAGWKFDALTSGYGPAVKVGIRKAIEKYFETLRMTTADMERDLCSTHDSIEAFKKTLDEHHGSGYVYIMVPIAQEEESRRKFDAM
ncbi:hypothetical protein BGZ54_004487 [Gamsiella multidivaricata]|nr:hypothetical protein BGZ54_004487 [Gamsiella multidivaricata]